MFNQHIVAHNVNYAHKILPHVYDSEIVYQLNMSISDIFKWLDRRCRQIWEPQPDHRLRQIALFAIYPFSWDLTEPRSHWESPSHCLNESTQQVTTGPCHVPVTYSSKSIESTGPERHSPCLYSNPLICLCVVRNLHSWITLSQKVLHGGK